MFEPQDLSNLVSQLIPELEAVGEVVAQMQSLPNSEELHIAYKADQSPVCAADRLSHTSLKNLLQGLTPDIEIVSEEDQRQIEPANIDDTYCWVIDPLDGTSGYVAGRKEFTINVALLYKRKPVIGLLHAPATGETVSGWRFDLDRKEVYLSQHGVHTSLLPSAQPKDEIATIVCSRRKANTTAQLEQLWPGTHVIIQDAATKFMTVIKNHADVYLQFHPTKAWDTVAAQVLLENLGGGFYTLDGRAYQIGNLLDNNTSFFAVRTKGHHCKVVEGLRRMGAA